MTGTSDAPARGLSSLNAGFDKIGMPTANRQAAIEIVQEVLAANGRTEEEISWYITPGKPRELCCTWDGAGRNVLWVTRGELHVRNDPAVALLPNRPVTFQPEHQRVVGWYFAG